jgi:hypothetical protein
MSDKFDDTLKEIGRITTTWAKFEHWIDQAIWILADVDARKGACITSQVQSIHGKFRALLALMESAGRPQTAIDAANKISSRAASVVNVRNRFAHGPLDMGVNFETREFEMYSRRVGNTGKSVIFETVALTAADLQDAQTKISELYQQLLKDWQLIVGASSVDELAPPHQRPSV